MAFLEAILAASGGGGGSSQIEEGNYEVTDAKEMPPISMSDPDFLYCYKIGDDAYHWSTTRGFACIKEQASQRYYVFPIFDFNNVVGGYITGGSVSRNSVTLYSNTLPQQIIAADAYLNTGTWHYVAVKFTS